MPGCSVGDLRALKDRLAGERDAAPLRSEDNWREEQRELLLLRHAKQEQRSAWLAHREAEEWERAKGEVVNPARQRTLGRQHAAAEAALAKAEKNPTSDTLNAAHQAITQAKQIKLSEEATLLLEKRLMCLENRFRPQMKMEARLRSLIGQAEWVFEGEDRMQALRSDARIDLLRSALVEAHRTDADPELTAQAGELLRCSIRFSTERKAAEARLDRSVHRLARTKQDELQLQEAIAEGQRCGINVRRAQHELEKLHFSVAACETLEKELVEAAKGHGPEGHLRLKDVVSLAKRTGVDKERVDAARAVLNQHERHSQQCDAMVSKIRERLAVAPRDIEGLQELVTQAQPLKPWTYILERGIRAASTHLEHEIAAKHAREAKERREKQAQERRCLDTMRRTGSKETPQHSPRQAAPPEAAMWAAAATAPTAPGSRWVDDPARAEDRPLRNPEEDRSYLRAQQAKFYDEVEKLLRLARGQAEGGTRGKMAASPRLRGAGNFLLTEPRTAR